MPFLLQRAHYNKKKVGVSVSHPSAIRPQPVRIMSGKSRDFVGAHFKMDPVNWTLEIVRNPFCGHHIWLESRKMDIGNCPGQEYLV